MRSPFVRVPDAKPIMKQIRAISAGPTKPPVSSVRRRNSTRPMDLLVNTPSSESRKSCAWERLCLRRPSQTLPRAIVLKNGARNFLDLPFLRDEGRGKLQTCHLAERPEVGLIRPSSACFSPPSTEYGVDEEARGYRFLGWTDNPPILPASLWQIRRYTYSWPWHTISNC